MTERKPPDLSFTSWIETVQDLPSEQEVRAVVADLNRRIIEWRRIPTGPPVFLPLLDAESLASRWQDAHATPPPPPPPARAPAPPTRRWRRRRAR
jgi:hypothetical protein